MFLTSLKQTCNEYLIKFSENQSAPKLGNRKTSPCSPCAPNSLHVLVSRIIGYHNLCSPAPTLHFSDCCVSLLKDNVTQAQETKPGKIDNVWQKPGNSLKTRFDSDSENHPSLSSAFILPNHKVFKSFLICSRVPQPTLRRLLKSGGNLSKSIAMYILNLIYKQPLTTSVMRGGGWMTAIINLAIIFTFIDQQ